MSTLVRQAVSGAAFGAALCLSGVWVPSVVLGQLRLEDFRMLRMFLTASGASILILGVFSGRGLPRTSPRTPSPIAGVLGSTTDKYAGNIIGGLMQGLGMALAGACASTVLVQAAVGTHPGLYTLLGAAVGGFLHVPISGWVKNRNAAAATAIEQEPSGGSSTETSVVPSNVATGPAKLTIYEQLGISRSACVLAADLISVGILAGLTLQPKTAASKAMDATFIDPIVGGLLVAAAQVVALLTRGSPLGVSNVFDEIGNIIWAGVDAVAYLGSGDAGKAQQKKKRQQLSVTGLAFAGGMMLAASATLRLVLSPLAGDALQQGLSPARAVVGGLLIGLGSRVSGGCTSGHGISGLGLLSTSSLITTACMFGGGILFGHIL